MTLPFLRIPNQQMGTEGFKARLSPALGNPLFRLVLWPMGGCRRPLIPIRFQAETHSLVFWTVDFVARSLQIAADMRLARASPTVQNPARLSLISKANWN
jgi:hypothetical protein